LQLSWLIFKWLNPGDESYAESRWSQIEGFEVLILVRLGTRKSENLGGSADRLEDAALLRVLLSERVK
jgi:hypothetical protein